MRGIIPAKDTVGISPATKLVSGLYLQFLPSDNILIDPLLVSDKSKSQIKKDTGSAKEESSSSFQRQRVDMLLSDLIKKFPIPQIAPATIKKEEEGGGGGGDEKTNGQQAAENNIKQEKNDGGWPPEKKMKFN